VQVLQLGFIPSHFSFLFRHIMHARRLVFGTLAFPLIGKSAESGPASETMMVSGGVPADDDDMLPGMGKPRRGTGLKLPPTQYWG
jgi:hypothetical protein